MNKESRFFLYLMCGISLLAANAALSDVPTYVAFNRFIALAGLFLVTVTLLIGPLAILWPQRFAALIEPRRAVGIASFVPIAIHFLISFWKYFRLRVPPLFDNLPFLLGTVALLIFAILTLLSADWATKRLGAALWKGVQRLNYFAFAATLAHFVFKRNGLLPGDPNFPNPAEIVLTLFAVLTIAFQLVGFFTVRKRKRDAELKERAKRQLETEAAAKATAEAAITAAEEAAEKLEQAAH